MQKILGLTVRFNDRTFRYTQKNWKIEVHEVNEYCNVEKGGNLDHHTNEYLLDLFNRMVKCFSGEFNAEAERRGGAKKKTKTTLYHTELYT